MAFLPKIVNSFASFVLKSASMSGIGVSVYSSHSRPSTIHLPTRPSLPNPPLHTVPAGAHQVRGPSHDQGRPQAPVRRRPRHRPAARQRAAQEQHPAAGATRAGQRRAACAAARLVHNAHPTAVRANVAAARRRAPLAPQPHGVPTAGRLQQVVIGAAGHVVGFFLSASASVLDYRCVHTNYKQLK